MERRWAENEIVVAFCRMGVYGFFQSLNLGANAGGLRGVRRNSLTTYLGS